MVSCIFFSCSACSAILSLISLLSSNVLAGGGPHNIDPNACEPLQIEFLDCTDKKETVHFIVETLSANGCDGLVGYYREVEVSVDLNGTDGLPFNSSNMILYSKEITHFHKMKAGDKVQLSSNDVLFQPDGEIIFKSSRKGSIELNFSAEAQKEGAPKRVTKVDFTCSKN